MRSLPSRVARRARGLVRRWLDPVDHGAFVDRFFAPGEYERLVDDFEAGPARRIHDEARDRYARVTGGDFGAVGLRLGRDLYALVRSLEPDAVVETGVCNGVSSLCLLLALADNGRGRLHSVDLPYRADEDLAAFRDETFEGYGGAALPPGEAPGWIVPDGLRPRWSLVLGRSQRELPPLLAELGEIDLFLHDSEHSFPCMMFEFEAAWERLRSGGVIVADDIAWNDAFECFADARGGERGRITRDAGYLVKPRAAGSR